MNREVNRRIVETWMRAGVTIVDPDTTWIQPDVDICLLYTSDAADDCCRV